MVEDNNISEEIIEEESIQNKNGKNKDSKFPVFILGLCLGLLLSLLLIILSNLLFRLRPTANGSVTVQSAPENVLTREVNNKVKMLNEFINRYYLDETDAATLQDGIYKGMIESLGDPYSTYYNAEELKKIEQSNRGMFYGVGLSLRQEQDTMYIYVNEVLKDTPADGSGIEPEDVLYAVDDEVIVGQTLSDVVMKVKGDLGTEVKITMYRDGEYMDYVFKRGEVKNETVTFEMKDDEIAYLRVTNFEKVTLEQFESALKEANEKDAKGLVLDLRGNPGGDLSVVVSMCDLLLPEGMIVYTEDKYGARDEFKSDANVLFDRPLVVLVDGSSASASEIMAGAIKDYKRGLLVGTQTFGKGIVQRVLSLGDGTAVKLTISKYYTPNGNNIHKIGIEPDEVVEFDSEAYKKDEIDNQLEKAIELLKKDIK